MKLKYDHIVHKVQICTFVQLCAAVKEEEQQQQQQCMSLFSFVVVFYFILKIQQMQYVGMQCSSVDAKQCHIKHL